MKRPWQNLTDLVAEAVGVPLRWAAAGAPVVAYHAVTGERFDPVRDNGDAFRLAAARVHFRCEAGFTIAWTPAAPELCAIEYDKFHNGDALRAARVAICRAILIAKHAPASNPV